MEIRTIEAKKALGIEATVAADKLPENIGSMYGELAAFMQKKAIPVTEAPYVLYKNMDPQALQIVAAFPVSQDVQTEGRIIMTEIPGGTFVHCVHKGPYTELEKTYAKVMDYIKEKKVETQEWMYESYINSPEDTAPEELLTELFFPLK